MMKLLLVILGVVIAVNGAAVKLNLSKVDFKRIGEELLKAVKILQHGMMPIYDKLKYHVNLNLKQTPEVKNVVDQYIAGLADQSLDDECAVSVDKHYFQTLDNISAGIMKKALKNVTDDEEKLNQMLEDKYMVQLVLQQNFDQEVQKCVKDSNECSMETYIEITEQTFEFFKSVALKIITYAETEFYSDDIQEQVKEYVANVPKCLTGKK